MMTRGLWGVFLCAALGLGGCKRITKEILREVAKESSGSEDGEAFDPNAPSKEIQVEWPEEGKFQLPGEPEKYADISIYEGTYQVTLHGMPKGSLFIVGDKKSTVDSSVFDIVKVQDMTKYLGSLEIAKLGDAKLDPNLSAELKIPGKHAKIKLPPARILGLDDILEKVENSPVVFEGEPKKEGEGFSILLLSGLRPEVFGKATLLQDVDGIALVRKLDAVKGTKQCTGYKDKDDKPAPPITLQLKETEAVIYDRRTADEVAKTVFPPDEECPMFSFGTKKDRTTDSSTPTKKIEEWIRSQVKR